MTGLNAHQVFTHPNMSVFTDRHGDVWQLRHVDGRPKGPGRKIMVPLGVGGDVPDSDAHKLCTYAPFRLMVASGGPCAPAPRRPIEPTDFQFLTGATIENEGGGVYEIEADHLITPLGARIPLTDTNEINQHAPFYATPATEHLIVNREGDTPPKPADAVTTLDELWALPHRSVVIGGAGILMLDPRNLVAWYLGDGGKMVRLTNAVHEGELREALPMRVVYRPDQHVVTVEPGAFGVPVKTYTDGGQQYGPYSQGRPATLVDRLGAATLAAAEEWATETFGPLVSRLEALVRELGARLNGEDATGTRDERATPTVIRSATDLGALPMGLTVRDLRGLETDTYMTEQGADVQFFDLAGEPVEPMYPLTVAPITNPDRLWEIADGVELVDNAGDLWVTSQVDGKSAVVALSCEGKGLWIVTQDMKVTLPLPFTFNGWRSVYRDGYVSADAATIRPLRVVSTSGLWALPVGVRLTDRGGSTWYTVAHDDGTGIQYSEEGQTGEVLHRGNYAQAKPVPSSELFPFTVEPFENVADLLRLGDGVKLRDRNGWDWTTYQDPSMVGGGVGLQGPVTYWLGAGDPTGDESHPLEGQLPFPFTFVP